MDQITKAYMQILNESIYDDAPKADTYTILEEFKDDLQRGIPKKMWNLIPAQQYANALLKFSRSDPETFVFSDRLLDDWLDIIITNTSEIDAISNLTGRNALNGLAEIDADAVCEVFPNEYKQSLEELTKEGYKESAKGMPSGWLSWQIAYDTLNKLGFYDWAVMPDGKTADSDNGTGGVIEVLEDVDFDSSMADKIVAINRCLDVFHQRSDWASAFIEGGRETLWEISNGIWYEKHPEGQS